MGDEVVLFVEESISSSSIAECRICHDDEVGSANRLEAPCACSGTVKFAHRECVQRWCNEKGDTTCEICLQKFEPDYTAPPKKAEQVDVVMTIRGSLEVPNLLRRQEQELQHPGLMAIVAAEPEFSECSSAAERSASCRRFVVLTLGTLLLLRHLLALVAGETDHHEFPVLTILVLRAGGIIVPLYIIMQIITAIQRMQQRQYQEFDDTSPLQVDEDDDTDEDEHLNHTVHTQMYSSIMIV
ncbi:E3 ubiquitin-protein ligase MARCHF7 [Macadamia integrifolia]|uniref:E3 ubiquitin-protein ligase MARCHF7 n=1 Tax=Macadamia integrifolia TaxID=60698 RepID=UPI001C532B32|nr:E3 ubiquitin-protein ligase MARCHF7 [Macadamia integrifolia]